MPPVPLLHPITPSVNPDSVFHPAPTPTLSSLLFFPSLYSVSLAHRVLLRRAHSVPTVTSLPVLLHRVCLTNILPQKCHLTVSLRERQLIKSQGSTDLIKVHLQTFKATIKYFLRTVSIPYLQKVMIYRTD